MGKNTKKEKRFIPNIEEIYKLFDQLGYKSIKTPTGYIGFEDKEGRRAYAFAEVRTEKGIVMMAGWSERSSQNEGQSLTDAAVHNVRGRVHYLERVLGGTAKNRRDGKEFTRQEKYIKDKWERITRSLEGQKERLNV